MYHLLLAIDLDCLIYMLCKLILYFTTQDIK